jgi:NitT/TauT family transport system substrate-binding protein
MISDSDEIKEISDLKGKTIYSTGQATTPEYTLNYILEKNGLVPGEDVKIEYKSEATEVAALMTNTKGAVAMLPQPYVTTVLANNEQFKIVLDMTSEWDKISDGAPLITGVVVARTEVIEKNRVAFDEFLKEYEASTKYVNENVEEAANMLEERDVFKAAIAKKAIPYCNIEFINGDKLKEKVSSYLEILYNANSNSVGGKLPKEDFYLE